MATIRNFETEEELTRENRAMTMTFTRSKEERYNERLAKDYYKQVLYKLGSATRHFLNEDRKNELRIQCKKIADLTEGFYQVGVMPYEDLQFALKNGINILVGFPSARTVFAVIDDSARFVGIYVPKSRRQKLIESKIDNAISELRIYFEEEKHVKFDEKIGEVLAMHLWNQKYPCKVPNMVIRGTKNLLNGDNVSEYLLSKNKMLQVKFEPGKNTVIYHIKKVW